MKKKMLAAAIASALAVPSAFAAIDDAGMKYTSAAEGFYGSLRFALVSAEDDDASIGHESSRIGIQGDVDIGHGNTAFYRAEWRTRYTNGEGENPFESRLTYVGMRGAYGSVRFGQIWSADYDYVTSLTDVTNNVTGNLAPRFRVDNALRYDSPDIQGFNFSIQLHADGGPGKVTRAAVEPRDVDDDDGFVPATFDDNADGDDRRTSNPPTVGDFYGAYFGLADPAEADTDRRTGAQKRADFRRDHNVEEFQISDTDGTSDEFPRGMDPVEEDGVLLPQNTVGLRRPAVTEQRDPDDGNEFDRYILAASYGIRGVNVAATYVSNQAADGAAAGSDEDEISWGIGGAYGQDNWRVGYLYWDTSDYRHGNGDDLTGHSFAGQVSFDKVTLRAVYDTQELEPGSGGSADTDAFTLEAQYSFSSKARAYATYQNVDREAGGAGFFGGASDSDPEDSDTFYVAYRVDF